MADPTIRERLRELAERHEPHSQHWTGETLVRDHGNVHCLFDEQGWPCDTRIVLDELDTLERRAIAATELEKALREAAANNHDEGNHGGYAGPGRFEDCSDTYCRAARAALEASRGSA